MDKLSKMQNFKTWLIGLLNCAQSDMVAEAQTWALIFMSKKSRLRRTLQAPPSEDDACMMHGLLIKHEAETLPKKEGEEGDQRARPSGAPSRQSTGTAPTQPPGASRPEPSKATTTATQTAARQTTNQLPILFRFVYIASK